MNAPSRYQRKPVQVDAWQFDPDGDPIGLALWCGGTVTAQPTGPGETIFTLTFPQPDERFGSGEVIARPGDWVVRGSDDLFGVLGPDEFTGLYEPVPTPPVPEPAVAET